MATPLRKSTASQVVQFTMVSSTDFITPKTGLSIASTDIKLIFEGGTTQTSKNSGGATEIGSTGTYYMTLDATDTATLGRLHIDVQKSGALPYWKDTEVLPALVWDALYASSGGAIMSDLQTVKTQTVTCAGGVTIPAATLASTTNITGGTITTVTNVTNAPTAGDFTTAMKTALNAATPASIQNVAAQTGDAYARIGANGAGLTSLAPASTALSTAVWTPTLAAALAAAYGRPYVWVPAGTTSYTLITGAAAGSVVEMDPSAVHAWGNHNATLAAGVTLIGNNATITSSADLNTLGAIIGLSDNCQVINLRVIGTSTTVFQAPMGFGTAGQAAATDVVIEDCYLQADTDGFFFEVSVSTVPPTRVTIRRCVVRTKFDTLFAIGGAGVSGWESWSGKIIVEDCYFRAEGSSVVDPSDALARAVAPTGFTIVVRGGLYVAGGAAGGAGATNATIYSDNVNGVASVEVSGGATLRSYGTGTIATAILTNTGSPPTVAGNGTVLAAGDCNANPALPSFVTYLPTQAVVPADGSITTGKLGTFALAKGTNITGFNDIAASAIVSNGAITTSSGAVSTVSGVTGLDTSTIAAAVRDVSNSSPASGSLGEAVRGADAKAAVLIDTIGTPANTTVSNDIAAVSGRSGGTGTGDIPVNQDTGGTDTLRYTTSGGSGIDGADVYAYLTAEWNADPAGATVRGHVRTGSDGRWTENMMLDAGAYTFVFVASGYEVATVAQAVA